MKKLILEGRFHVQHIRDKKIIADFEFKNGICDAGVNSMWDTFFGVTSPVSQVATWYIGLVDGATTPTFLAADTLASHTGWTENTNYSGNRKAWNNLTAASARAKNSVSNSSFTINATVTIFGLFLCAAATGTSAVLWSTGAFPNGPVACVNADVLQVTYGVSGQ